MSVNEQQFLKFYYKKTCDCLMQEEKTEELIFFKLGVELAVRPKELITITYEQIDFEKLVINNIPNIKEYSEKYPPKKISKEIAYLIKENLCVGENKPLFNKPLFFYQKSISQSNGDEGFSNHMIRHIGILTR